jgi:hypothetical protein
MVAGRTSRVERTIGRETKRSSSASDQKFDVERTAEERIGFKRNNRIEIA